MGKKIYNAAIIGCGNIAGDYDIKIPTKYTFTHAESYVLSKRVKLIAISDINKKKLTKFKDKWKVKRSYTNYEEMLNTEKIDILSICSPTETHFNILKYATKNKKIKTIFLEKPSTFKASETKFILKSAKKISIVVNYFRRWNESFIDFKKKFLNNNLQKIKKIEVRYTKGIYVSCSHQIDLMRFFFGEPINFKIIKKYKKFNNDSGIDFILKFKNNIEVYFLHIPNVNYAYFDINFYLENKILNISQRGQIISEYTKVEDSDYNKFCKITRSKSYETNWKNCLFKALNEIILCLDKETNISSSNLLNAYKNTLICEKIFKKRL